MTQSSQSTSVGLIQMTCQLGDPQANLTKAETLLAQLAGKVRIACLPELFDTGYNLDVLGDQIFELAQVIPNPLTDHLCQLARQFKLAIIAGILEKDPDITGLLYDTAVLVSHEGELIGRYRKSHLYPAEYSFFCAGDALPIFTLNGLKVGIAICYEHAFPQIFTTLALHGVQIVFNPSAVPVGYSYLQNLRTRARAQDNQMFVAAINHVGREGDVVYCGESQLADPRGDVVALASDTREMALVAPLDLDLIADQRKQEPVFRGFRPDLYRPTNPM